MGILSWFRSRRSADVPGDERNNLIKYRYEDPDFEPIEQAVIDLRHMLAAAGYDPEDPAH